ncbi:MAG: hypothetical protein QXT53_02320 [Ignisphaera sp.]
MSSITALASIIQSVLGGDWDFFLSYIKATIVGRVYVLLTLGLFRDLLAKTMFLSGMARLISMVINSITASLYTLLVMYSLSVFVKYSFWVLLSLGLALMAIPFRVARGAGAFLIAFALVFNSALPLYLQFVKTLIFPASSNPGDFIVYGSIVNMDDHVISQGFIGLEYNGEYIAPLPTYSGVYAILTDYRGNVTIYFDVCGHMFYTNITNVSIFSLCRSSSQGSVPFLCRLNLRVLGLIDYRKGVALHVAPFPDHVNVTIFTENYVEVYFVSHQKFDLYISIVDAYNIKSLNIDSEAIEDVDRYIKYKWNWFDLFGKTYVINIPEGLHKVVINLEQSAYEKLEPSESYIYIAQSRIMNYNNLPGIFDELIRVIYVDIIGAALYMSLLISISIGLAKAIGGTARLRVVL